MTVHMNSQEEETVMKAHGLGELSQDHHGHLLPTHWETLASQPVSIGSATMKPPRLLINQHTATKGSYAEVTKTLVIINKDHETTSTAQTALTDKRRKIENYMNKTELCIPHFSLHRDVTL